MSPSIIKLTAPHFTFRKLFRYGVTIIKNTDLFMILKIVAVSFPDKHHLILLGIVFKTARSQEYTRSQGRELA